MRALYIVGAAITVAVASALGWSLFADDYPSTTEITLETRRNFYGVLRVKEEADFADANGPRLSMLHGRTEHGFQYLDPEKSRWPTTYYGRPSGVGLAITYHPQREQRPLRIGVVGLGCGTLAVYGREGDYFRFYEINPEVKHLSDKYFTYRQDSAATIDVVLGDARIKMEQELAAGDPQRFDVLAVDAFSSDAIPMHLLTLECAHLYREHLAPGGLLCLHISNRFLDLAPVTRGLAEALDCEAVLFDCNRDSETGVDYSMWVVLTDNWGFLNTPEVSEAIQSWPDLPPPLLWTDDYASLYQVLDKS